MPEIIPINANVHFKCAFDIIPKKAPQPMTHLRQKLRTWCLRKIGENEQTLHRAWFYIGNNPKIEPAQYSLSGHQIRTVIAPSDDPDEPTCWAMEVIHADFEVSARRWSAEVTLRQHDDGSIRFTTVIKYWMIPYFIGEYPEPPAPTTPYYVRSVLTDPALECRRGDALLESEPVVVSQQMVRGVFDSLISAERRVPFVLVAHGPSRGPAVTPGFVARSVLGNANVFVLGSSSVVDEMNYYLGDAFRCDHGSVRVYVPNLDRSNPDNARLHRYLSTTFIDAHGEDEVIRYLTNGLSRNGVTFRLGDLTSFNDIFSERRKYTIRKLADAHDKKSEETDMVWKDNETLSSQASTWESLAIQYGSENELLKKENGSLIHRIDEAERIRGRVDDLESQLSGLHAMAACPTDLLELLECFQKLFPKRISVTDAARVSARTHSEVHDNYWCKPDQLAIAWGMVFAAVTRLHDLIFVEQHSDLEMAFKGHSIYELAMSEGKQTKKDAGLMKLRRQVHLGKDYDITPHLKFGNRLPKMLRLHFAIDRDDKTLVVGHFGDHMENYSSRKH